MLLNLEEANLRFAARLRRLDSYHPLVERMEAPPVSRGSKTLPTRLQRTDSILPAAPRPQLLLPQYAHAQHCGPLISKEEAARDFTRWLQSMSPEDIIAYSDGSKQ